MNIYLKKTFDFFIFTSLFVACCAVVMVYQTYELILHSAPDLHFSIFVFCSTVCSYNLHWALTPHTIAPSQRLKWDENHKNYHLLLSLSGLVGAIILFFYLIDHWFIIGIAALLSFLYSAPKISFRPFQWLKKIAVGKTIFLAMAWTYVTATLPLLIENNVAMKLTLAYSTSQFFFIYAICILFDFRDKEDDKADGIRSTITFFNEKAIDWIFALSVVIFAVLIYFLSKHGISWSEQIALFIPAIILTALYKYAKKNFSDYLYYFVLDGLMMLSGILIWLMHQF